MAQNEHIVEVSLHRLRGLLDTLAQTVGILRHTTLPTCTLLKVVDTVRVKQPAPRSFRVLCTLSHYWKLIELTELTADCPLI